MGDAVRDGDVAAAELDETIDAADSRPQPTSLPAEVLAATRDYQELQAVERHHYVITKELARGGMGRVVEARDLRLGRQVAIKELLPKNRDAARRFEREARITARLSHPSIIHIYEAGVWPGGEPFYAMPHVAGRSFDKVVGEKTTLAERVALLPHVIAVADALAYAHNANVIHRDLKPGNVLIGEYGETVVIDWGLAKDLGVYTDPKESMQLRLRATGEETVSGSVVGTPAYMPPEQARGDAVDQRADVYALGALLYKVLAGVAPYQGNSAKEVLELVKTTPPIPVHERAPDAPPDLLAIVNKAMARDPKDRYITASELAKDLKRFETGQLVGAHRYTIGQLARRWLRRHRVAVAIGGIGVLALIALGVYSFRRIVNERNVAQGERDRANSQRASLAEERGRAELLDGHAERALGYLADAAEDGVVGGARGFLIADAMRPFEAEVARARVGAGDVVVAVGGKFMASAGAGPIELWGPDGRRRSLGTFGITRVLAFDAKGTRLAAAGDDGMARVWSVDGTLIAELRGHDGAIVTADFSPDGATLVTGGGDGTVRLWNLATKTAIVSMCHSGRVTAVHFSHDGTSVVSASEDNIACVIKANGKGEDPGEGQDTSDVLVQLRGHTSAINSVMWSPDDRYIVTASDDGTARVWGPNTGMLLVRKLAHRDGSVVRVALPSHDGRYIATAGSDFVARVWQLPDKLPDDNPKSVAARATGNAKLVEQLIGQADIGALAFSADDAQLATGALDGLAKVWDLGTGQPIATFPHNEAVTSVAFAPDEAQVATGSRDGIAHVWRTVATKARHDCGSEIHAIAASGDGVVAAARDDSKITWLGSTYNTVLSGHDGRVLAVAFTPDNMFLLSGGDDPHVFVWSNATGAHDHSFGDFKEPVRALAVGPDPDRVAVLTGTTVELWSRTHRLATLGDGADAISISAQTGAIAAVGRDGSLRVWDARGKPLLDKREPGAPYTTVGFAPAGDAVVAAGPGVAHVWDVRTATKLTIEGPINVPRAAIIAGDGALVITAGDDGVASIWDRHKGKLLGRRAHHKQPITALAARGDTLWVASADGTLAAWDIRIETRAVAALKQFMVEKKLRE